MRAYREILSLPGAWQFSAAGLLAHELVHVVVGSPGGGVVDFPVPPVYDLQNPARWMREMSDWTYSLGKPLVVGLILLASMLATTGYFVVKALWRWHLVLAWHRRRRTRAQRH